MDTGTTLTPDKKGNFDFDITGEHLRHKDFPKLSVVPSPYTYSTNMGTLNTSHMLDALSDRLEHFKTNQPDLVPYIQGTIHVRPDDYSKHSKYPTTHEVFLNHNFPSARHRNRGATLLPPEHTRAAYELQNVDRDSFFDDIDSLNPSGLFTVDMHNILNKIVATNILKEYMRKPIQEKRERHPETTKHLSEFITLYKNLPAFDSEVLHNRTLHPLYPKPGYHRTNRDTGHISYADALAQLFSKKNDMDIEHSPNAVKLRKLAVDTITSYLREKGSR
jgi:hypothetical protein